MRKLKSVPLEPVASTNKKKREWRNKKQSFKKTVNQPKVGASWNSAWKCSMAKLINLSKISSSEVEVPKEQVLFDSGANCCVTNRKEDFVGECTHSHQNEVVDGIGKGLKIEGAGKVAWTFNADNGMHRTIVVPCYYIPSAHTRIASVQVVLGEHPRETVSMSNDKLTLSGFGHHPAITVPHCPASNLPMAETLPVKLKVFRAKRPSDKVATRDPLPDKKHPSLTTVGNINLSEPEKELLRWHQRLGHISMKRVQWLFAQGLLSGTEHSRRLQTSAAKLTHGPLCTACQCAKQRRKTKPGSIKATIKSEAGALKQDDLFPGKRISVDHFESNPKGRLLHTFGKEASDSKFKGGCIFVDHCSGYVHIELQVKLNAPETIKAKDTFERFCADHGVVVQKCISDHGSSFDSQAYKAHLETLQQSIRHATPGGHHTNGVAERAIGTVMSIARAMLHHAAIHWPDVASAELWPLAVLHAVHLLNRIPRQDTGRSPLELFSRKTWSTTKLHDLHVWGCPVCVLDSALADGRKLPRWTPRSSRSICMGHGLHHNHSAPMVLNPETGKITTQCHVVFDDWFQTIEATVQAKIDFDHEDWYKTFGLTEAQCIPDDEHSIDQAPVPTSESEGASGSERLGTVRDEIARPEAAKIVPVPISEQPALQRESDPNTKVLPSSDRLMETWESVPTPKNSASQPSGVLEVEIPAGSPLEESSRPGYSSVEEVQEAPIQREQTPSEVSPPIQTSNEVATPAISRPKAPTRRTAPSTKPMLTRSQAAPRRSERLSGRVNAATAQDGDVLDDQDQCDLHQADPHQDFQRHSVELPFVGKAANTDPDTCTWEQAMASPHREQFLEAAQREIDEPVKKGTWHEDSKSNATAPIAPSTWAFRVKRSSDGTVKKFKGRICLGGDLLQGNGLSTCSPVAAWATVRSFLTISQIRQWETATIDFSNAFVQSNLPDDEPVWMHVPRGYRSTQGPGHCLKLVKSLCGHTRAPQLWHNYSTDAFKKLGLKQSKFDECLWCGKDIMIAQCVDDCGISAPNKARIDQFVADLRQLGFELTQEESFDEFLGIKFANLPNGSIECTQKGLIKKTLEAANMIDCNPNSTPASQVPLGADKDGAPMDEKWNYRGICGMLLHLSTNTRPDIAFAVSQVCRFGHDPKKSHATAVKTTLRHLKKTADKGHIINPKGFHFSLDLCVDSDFCGLFGNEDPRDQNSVRSRTGCVILLSGWPIIWKSQLATHLSQSTLEAEHCALSSSLRTFLPLRWLIEEIISNSGCHPLEDVRLHANVFEDNQSTYFLATNQRITNRTKCLLAKWHWFWAAYNRKEFSIIKCPTDQQLSDYLTKSQPKATFETNREGVQGW